MSVFALSRLRQLGSAYQTHWLRCQQNCLFEMLKDWRPSSTSIAPANSRWRCPAIVFGFSIGQWPLTIVRPSKYKGNQIKQLRINSPIWSPNTHFQNHFPSSFDNGNWQNLCRTKATTVSTVLYSTFSLQFA